jgi:hypothetical protein
MRDIQADGIGKEHPQPARDPVPFAGDVHFRALQRLDHRQCTGEKKKSRAGSKPLDPPPLALQMPFGMSRKLLHQQTTSRIH